MKQQLGGTLFKKCCMKFWRNLERNLSNSLFFSKVANFKPAVLLKMSSCRVIFLESLLNFKFTNKMFQNFQNSIFKKNTWQCCKNLTPSSRSCRNIKPFQPPLLHGLISPSVHIFVSLIIDCQIRLLEMIDLVHT